MFKNGATALTVKREKLRGHKFAREVLFLLVTRCPREHRARNSWIRESEERERQRQSKKERKRKRE